jgi:drug/metabolite transporter (DMT)-like permease
MGEPTKLSRGPLLGLAAAVLFGVSTPLAKLLLGDIPPVLLAGLLYLGSGLGLGLWRVARRGDERLARADWPWLAGAIGCGGMLGPLLLMQGLAHTTATTASLLLNLEGVFTALVAWFVFHENFDRRIVAGMIAITAGAALLSWSGRPEWKAVVGPMLIAGACACWALDNNFTRRISAADPVQIAALKGGVAGIVNVGIGFALGATRPPLLSVAGAGMVGLLGYGVSLVLFIRALRYVGAARTAAYFSTAPFFGAATSVLIVREPITSWLLAAGALMAVGVWLHVTERHEHRHAHEEMTHAHWHTHDEHHQHTHDQPVAPGTRHSHEHKHDRIVHSHAHYPDIHHHHEH